MYFFDCAFELKIANKTKKTVIDFLILIKRYINLLSSFIQTSGQMYIILLNDVHLSALSFG